MVAKSTWRTTLAFCLAWASLAAFGGETDCADVRTDERDHVDGVRESVPTLQLTDLFRPYADPDDHWDLATQYALARRGDIDLLGVVIDDPVRTADLREARKKVKAPVKDPDIAAVAQLNWLTGLCVPVGVGQPKDEGGKVRSGLALLRRTLESSSSPVVLHVVGACTDVVEAADRWPELFRAKVKAIYVNAGTADDSDGQEYNVLLDPKTYGRVFALPCPIYWLPCFQRLKAKKGVHASYWNFAQHRAFSEMRPGVLNFFTGVFGKYNGTEWLSIIQAPVNEEAVKSYGEARRNMWCTAGFLHAAGLVVLRDGTIARLGEKPSEELFSFDPVLTDCHAQTGVLTWRAAEKSGNRFLLHVRDQAAYEEAMTRALVHLMKNL